MPVDAMIHLHPVTVKQMGLLLFAMEGLMSRLCLEHLVSSSVNIKGIALPANSAITNKPIRVLQEYSIEWLANKHQIPVFYINDKKMQSYQEALMTTDPEMILVACFPYLLPETVHTVPEYGSYNIHPSLLPAYRGPVPLFWQFHDGIKETGISVHCIENQFDRGDIILQSNITLPDGASTEDAIQLMVDSIKFLLPEVVKNIFKKNILPVKQDETKSGYFSWPKPEDFYLDTSWDVQRVYNFIKGTSHWNQLYHVTINNKDYMIKDAVSYERKSILTNTPVKKNNYYEIPFDTGLLMVKELLINHLME